MLNHVRNALAGAAAIALGIALTQIPRPPEWDWDDDFEYDDEARYWDFEHLPEPRKPYLIQEEDHITDLL